MASLIVRVRTASPVLGLYYEVAKIDLKVGGPSGDISDSNPVKLIDISNDPGNIINQRQDGLYATIAKADTILGFVAALDAAITK